MAKKKTATAMMTTKKTKPKLKKNTDSSRMDQNDRNTKKPRNKIFLFLLCLPALWLLSINKLIMDQLETIQHKAFVERTQLQQGFIVNNTLTSRLGHHRRPRPRPRQPRRSPHTVYWCGFDNLFNAHDNPVSLATHLFPERDFREYTTPQLFTQQHNASRDDVLLYAGGASELADHFPGIIAIFNGEAEAGRFRLPSHHASQRTVLVSAIDLVTQDHHHHHPQTQTEGNNNKNNDDAGIKVFFMSMHFATLGTARQARVLFPSTHPRGTYATKPHFLLYTASNCRPQHREMAFGVLSGLGPPVHYGGSCHGGKFPQHPDNIVPAPADVSAGGFTQNHLHLEGYRFALVMENQQRTGYMTEKIINAFVAGCIPIYYGTEEVFDVFAAQSFVYYNVSNPQPALDRIADLEAHAEAYDQVITGPILKDGDETIRKYFSWNDELGHGALKWFIRERMGYG